MRNRRCGRARLGGVGMSKRWSLTTFGPGRRSFDLVRVSFDWQEPYPAWDGEGATINAGWFNLSAGVFGFSFSLTYWRYPKQPDVYGDGGVA